MGARWRNQDMCSPLVYLSLHLSDGRLDGDGICHRIDPVFSPACFKRRTNL